MPYYRKRRTRKSRKPRKRRTYKSKMYRRPVSFGKMTSKPFGRTMTRRFRYVQLFNSLNVPATGLPVSHVYRMNCIFDPNFSGVGSSVLGFRECMAAYDHFVVKKCFARITFHNTDNLNAQIVALQVKDTGSTSPDLQNAIENGLTSYKMISPREGGKSTFDMRISQDMNKFFTRSVRQGDKYYGTETSSPVDGAFLHVTTAPANGIADTGVLHYSITMEFVATLSEPKTLLSS